MAAATVVRLPYLTVDEYLHTSYEPDVDYVDGRIEERNVGEWDHSDLQGEIISILRRQAKAWGIRAVPEVRVQTSATRFRVPDVCVVSASGPREQIVRTPPLLCIEILSPEDRFSLSVRKYRDYITMGVPEVWIFDPANRIAYVLQPDEKTITHRDGSLRLEGTPIELSLADVFGVLDLS
ncbi:Uma2 family endonuclease [Granulicella sp. S156]|jgi:Uma2 family endonuclease|uniref:Uma2 family endonuclease n=1 Tax=Granulicella sp. S156 TaxID=1747224 RepID=UPI00131A65E3|nr:Uma2 family endonuclease [Granulicella sp. S156]